MSLEATTSLSEKTTENQEQPPEYPIESNEILQINEIFNGIELAFDLAANLEISDEGDVLNKMLMTTIINDDGNTFGENIDIEKITEINQNFSDAEDDAELQNFARLVDSLLCDKDLDLVSDLEDAINAVVPNKVQAPLDQPEDTAGNENSKTLANPDETNNDIIELSSDNSMTDVPEEDVASEPKRILRKKPPVNYFLRTPQVKPNPSVTSCIAIGGLKLRLQLPGLFSFDIEIPPQGTKALTNFYDSLKGKFWKMSKRSNVVNPLHKWYYDCLICGKKYKKRDFIILHLNRHIGYHVARCTLCPAKFFSIKAARRHEKSCLKKHHPELFA